MQGCHPSPPHIPLPPPGVPLQEVCSHYNVQWQWDGVTQVVMLDYKGNKAKALVGSNVILLGKEKVLLSAPLRREQSTIYVPEDFESKVLAPFGVIIGKLTAGDLTVSRVRTIVIDAGHGGKDPGAKGISGVLEKEVVLDIARRIKGLLQDAGLTVIMTRDSDEFISLPRRTEIATGSSADLFVSIHANSNPSRKMQGIEVYYVKTDGKRDLDEDQRAKNERSFARKLSAADATAPVENILSDMMYNLKVAESKKVAALIVEQVSEALEIPNRGARSCRFFVVRNTLIPAVLIETGFLTNRQEEHKLNSPSYRQKLAEAVARGIIDYATN